MDLQKSLFLFLNSAGEKTFGHSDDLMFHETVIVVEGDDDVVLQGNIEHLTRLLKLLGSKAVRQ